MKKLLFFILCCVVSSCTSLKTLEVKSNEQQDLVSFSILDYSKTKAKKYPEGSIHYVTIDTISDRLDISIHLSDTRYIYKNKTVLIENPIPGSFMEIDKQLYHLRLDKYGEQIDNAKLIEYGLVAFESDQVDFRIDDFDDDLKYFMTYFYCLSNPNENIKVFQNNWNTYNKALAKLHCARTKINDDYVRYCFPMEKYTTILGRRIETPLTERYGTDILPNEEIVKKISEVILYERYINVDFEKLKPFRVNLIEDGKIWHFVAESNQSNVLFQKKYSILLNKNTGEVLSIWTVK